MRVARTTGSTVLCGMAACRRVHTRHRHGVGHRAKVTWVVANRAGRHRVVVVQRQRDVRAGKTGEQAVLQHRRRATAALFGRLADHHERALPAVAVFGHQARRARPRRHVNVVPARVHHRRRLSAGVPHDDRAGKRQAGLLFDRERVELGAKHDGRPGAILHDRDDARGRRRS